MSKTATPQATIPQSILERNENEWRQMQAGSTTQPKPATQASQG